MQPVRLFESVLRLRFREMLTSVFFLSLRLNAIKLLIGHYGYGNKTITPTSVRYFTFKFRLFHSY